MQHLLILFSNVSLHLVLLNLVIISPCGAVKMVTFSCQAFRLLWGPAKA